MVWMEVLILPIPLIRSTCYLSTSLHLLGMLLDSTQYISSLLVDGVGTVVT
jgi:hypothetical protein